MGASNTKQLKKDLFHKKRSNKVLKPPRNKNQRRRDFKTKFSRIYDGIVNGKAHTSNNLETYLGSQCQLDYNDAYNHRDDKVGNNYQHSDEEYISYSEHKRRQNVYGMFAQENIPYQHRRSSFGRPEKSLLPVKHDKRYNFNDLVNPVRPLKRHHSLNNDYFDPEFDQFKNDHHFRMQSFCLNNLYNGSYFGEQTSNYCQDRSSVTEWNRSNSSYGLYDSSEIDTYFKQRQSLSESSSFSDDNLINFDEELGSSDKCHTVISLNNETTKNDVLRATSSIDNLGPIESENQKYSALNFLNIPDGWTSYSLKNAGFVNVSAYSDEGERLSRYFNKTSRGNNFVLDLIQVMRIENPFLHTLYMLKKEEMQIRNSYVDEHYLYHGTKNKHVKEIMENNLNWRLIKKHKFGHGVSFSHLATYSSHYCDDSEIKVMILFKVLVCNAVIGCWDMVIPPLTNKGVVFDTSVNEENSVVVKYSDHEFYPLYLMKFRKMKIKH